MTININLKIDKRDLWIFSAIIVFLAGVIYVIALNSGDYSVMGHTYDELQTCPDGKILKTVGGVWSCADDVDTDTNTVSGLVTGGGYECAGCNSGQVWGGAYCSGGHVTCPSGSTKRAISDADDLDTDCNGADRMYLCIRN